MKADTKTGAAVMGAFNRLFKAYETRNWGTLSALLAPDPDVFLYGTGPDEKRTGLAEIKAQAERDWSQSEAASFKFQWHSVSAAGRVAWVAADGAVHARVGGEEVTMPVRVTTVFEQRGDKWLLAQMHASMPAGGQAEGESFTPPPR